MGARLNRKRLRFEMAQCGLSGNELALRAHLRPGTASQAINGRSVAPRTLDKLATALLSTEVISGLDELLQDAWPRRS